MLAGISTMIVAINWRESEINPKTLVEIRKIDCYTKKCASAFSAFVIFPGHTY